MATLAKEFVLFLKAIKANDGTAVTKHGTNVMGLYAKGILGGWGARANGVLPARESIGAGVPFLRRDRRAAVDGRSVPTHGRGGCRRRGAHGVFQFRHVQFRHALYGAPGPESDATGGAVASESGTLGGEDASSVVLFYGFGNPAPVQDDATTGASDAHEDGPPEREDAPSVVAFYGIANPVPVQGDATTGASDAHEDGPSEREDAPSVVAFYGIGNPVPVQGDATTGASDAHEDGPSEREDAPSVVAFYGIANPKPHG